MTRSSPASVGCATTPPQLGLASRDHRPDRLRAGRPQRRRDRRPAPRRRRLGLLGAGRDAGDRAKDRPPLRRLPPLLLRDRRPRLLAAGGAGLQARLRGGQPADRSDPAAEPARQPARPPWQRARRLRRRGDDLRRAARSQQARPGRGKAGADPGLGRAQGARRRDRRIDLLGARQKGRPADREANRTARVGRDRRGPRQPPDLPAGRPRGTGDRRRRLRKRGPDRARGRRGIGAARHRRRTPHRHRRERRTDPAGNRP